ncbi:MAG: low molecular weight phosphotyrosine protein phosphatase [Phycisphaerales bacterium]|nr:low molecular weight phosphotyrosine protein phosphatase [Phycisphaerales bacterium]
MSTSVLFVCLGNICRSPLAEAIFIHKADQQGVRDRFTIDSAGMGGWHAGERADPRSIQIGARYGIDVRSIARQVTDKDVRRFDYLIAMDRSNASDLRELGAPKERVHLMRAFDPGVKGAADVPDPYYGGPDGFQHVYEMLDAACDGLLEHLLG